MYQREQYTPENEFELDSDGQDYVIKKYIGSRTIVSIPPMIRGRKVSKIGSNAFVTVEKAGFLKYEYQSTVEKVILPETVTEIMSCAFMHAKTLRRVIAHPGIVAIGNSAFLGCDNLRIADFGVEEPAPGVVQFPQKLKKLGDSSFNKASGECIFREIKISKKTKWKMSALGNMADAFNASTCAVFYYEDGDPTKWPVNKETNDLFRYSPESDFELGSDGTNYSIRKYIGDKKFVSIPPVIRGRRVVSIESEAFCTIVKDTIWKREYSSFVEKVMIPKSVTKLQGAFSHCNNLHTVIAHPEIEEIGICCFWACDNLRFLDFGVGKAAPGRARLPDGLKKIGDNALNKSDGSCIFREVLLSKKTKWKASAFGNSMDAFNASTCAVFYCEDGTPDISTDSSQSGADSQYTPESEFELISVGTNYAIKRYTGNRSEVSVPPVIRGRKVVKLEDLAFSRMEKTGFLKVQDTSTVEKVILPETVTEIGKRAFYSCEKLHTVIAHPGITVIDDMAFAWCTNLKILDFGLHGTYSGIVSFPHGLKKLGSQSLAADFVTNNCIFEEIIIRKGMRVKQAFNPDSCRVFYHQE